MLKVDMPDTKLIHRARTGLAIFFVVLIVIDAPFFAWIYANQADLDKHWILDALHRVIGGASYLARRYRRHLLQAEMACLPHSLPYCCIDLPVDLLSFIWAGLVDWFGNIHTRTP